MENSDNARKRQKEKRKPMENENENENHSGVDLCVYLYTQLVFGLRVPCVNFGCFICAVLILFTSFSDSCTFSFSLTHFHSNTGLTACSQVLCYHSMNNVSISIMSNWNIVLNDILCALSGENCWLLHLSAFYSVYIYGRRAVVIVIFLLAIFLHSLDGKTNQCNIWTVVCLIISPIFHSTWFNDIIFFAHSPPQRTPLFVVFNTIQIKCAITRFESWFLYAIVTFDARGVIFIVSINERFSSSISWFRYSHIHCQKMK